MKATRACKQSVRDILVVGPFPPPVHGFAQATMDIAELLHAQGFHVTRIDLKPIKKSVALFLGIRLSQFVKLFGVVWQRSRVYVGLSGGMRQAIDLVFIAIGRLGGAGLYVHHHSFAYLNQPTSLARICMRLSGRAATHIVLCSGMKAALQRQYKAARNVEVMSNAGLKSVRLEFRNRTAIQTIGRERHSRVFKYCREASSESPRFALSNCRSLRRCYDQREIGSVQQRLFMYRICWSGLREQ